MDDRVVHMSDWAQQPDIRIKCSQEMTTPAWVTNALPGIYLADNNELYTFEAGKVTCPECLGS